MTTEQMAVLEILLSTVVVPERYGAAIEFPERYGKLQKDTGYGGVK
jgi:hypothetical protein